MLELPFRRENHKAFGAGSSSPRRVLRVNPCADFVKLTTRGFSRTPLCPGCGHHCGNQDLAQRLMCRKASQPSSTSRAEGPAGAALWALSELGGAAAGGARAGMGNPVTFSCIQSPGGHMTAPSSAPPAFYGPPLTKDVTRHLTRSCLRAESVFPALGIQRGSDPDAGGSGAPC